MSGKDDITSAVAREFINRVRKVLVEKNIPLDQRSRDFSRVCEIRKGRETDSKEKGNILLEGEDRSPPEPNRSRDTSGKLWSEGKEDTINVVHRDRFSRTSGRVRVSRSGLGSSSRSYSQRPGCYICGSTAEHFQRQCPFQYCQNCGKKGHDRRDCYAKKQVLSLNRRANAGYEGEGLDQAGVMIALKLNGAVKEVMLDSGVQPSIIDTTSLNGLGVDYTTRPSRVHGVCATPIKTRGYVDLEVEVGEGAHLNQTVWNRPSFWVGIS